VRRGVERRGADITTEHTESTEGRRGGDFWWVRRGEERRGVERRGEDLTTEHTESTEGRRGGIFGGRGEER